MMKNQLTNGGSSFCVCLSLPFGTLLSVELETFRTALFLESFSTQRILKCCFACVIMLLKGRHFLFSYSLIMFDAKAVRCAFIKHFIVKPIVYTKSCYTFRLIFR